MIGLLLALLAGSGVFLLWSSAGEPRRRGIAAWWHGPRRAKAQEWLTQAGLTDVAPVSFSVTIMFLVVLGTAVGYGVFFGPLPALAMGAAAGSVPVASLRARRQRLLSEARDAWPRLIEEMRIATGSMGRSVPQALLEVGRSAPDPMGAAFSAAGREWRMTTDFSRTVAVLQRGLADATADAACETLLVAHEVGGADLDRRLRSLAEDRALDLQGRKDALAKQAGVRFARRFVVIVPVGMALAGMSIGTGRAAYGTPAGQAAVLAAVCLIAACWAWAGHFMKLPQEQRVFRGDQR